MVKKIGVITLAGTMLLCVISFVYFGKNPNHFQGEKGNEVDNRTNISGGENMNEFTSGIKISMNGEEYNVTLEDNKTAREFVDRLPLSIKMNELNGNEKYYYFEEPLSSNASNIGTVNKGDILLYGDDCLVIFYESLNTSYSYTRIGKIENSSNLKEIVGNSNVTITFIR